MMTINDVKKYVVCINGGTGVVFQPMDQEYSYILTAKHVFNDIATALYNSLVSIQYYDNAANSFVTFTKFALNEGVNYFPHQTEGIDIAILKISRLDVGSEIIIKDDIFSDRADYILGGFPVIRRKGDQIGINWLRTDMEVTILGDRSNQKVEADVSKNQTQEELSGSSGGGIFKLSEKNILLAGIQSGVVSGEEALGRIEFTPIKVFADIVDNSNQTLEPILPAYMKCFSFLRDEAFRLEVDVFNEKDIVSIRNYLKNKVPDIVQSGITPAAIKLFFETRLLVSKSDAEILFEKNIWLVWLEFLTVLNIIKYQAFGEEQVTEIFNNYRLIYSNYTGEWTELLLNDLQYADYIGLADNALIFIGTDSKPAGTRKVVPGKLRSDISRVFDKTKFMTDGGFDPYNKFTFVHISYLQQECIITKLAGYRDKSEEELLAELKKQYNELFGL